jgi:hypothetical protein
MGSYMVEYTLEMGDGDTLQVASSFNGETVLEIDRREVSEAIQRASRSVLERVVEENIAVGEQITLEHWNNE